MKVLAVKLGSLLAPGLCLIMLTGCGGPASIARGTPRETAKAFVDAIQAADYDAIAKGWDYETYARSENPDWDELDRGKRKMIIDELQRQRADDVEALAGMLVGEVHIGETQTEGDRATLQLGTGMVHLDMTLINTEGVWKVLAIAEQGTNTEIGN